MRMVLTTFVRAVVVTLACGLVGCDGAVAPHNKRAPQEASQAQSVENLDTPPAKTLISVQERVTKTGKTSSGKTFSFTVTQYVINADANQADSLVCVGDGDHCITVTELSEQLHRPKNDPLGIRK